MSSIDEESLRKLSKSELKKQAKKKGIKVSMTVDKIITSLLEKSNADEDSFVTLERSILNSCKKNKEALFERDSKSLSETPRRDTYIVDTPSTSTKGINSSTIMASPELKQSKDESLNVTLNRGSERKSRKSKRKVSFVTPLRRSTRLSVATPKYNSVKGRPKTPMPSRMSSSKKPVAEEVNDSVACTLDLDVSEILDTKKISVDKVKRPSTPMPHSKQKKKLSSSGKSSNSGNQNFELTPNVIHLDELKEEDLKETSTISQSKVEVTPMPSSKKASVLTPGFKRIVTPFPESAKPKSARFTPRNHEKTPLSQSSSKPIALTPGFKKNATPFSSTKKVATPRSLIKSALTPGIVSSGVRRSPRSNVKTVSTPKLTSSSVKKTPNFNKLHQKAFEKLESISDYHQRKLLNSQKKKEEQSKFLNVAKSNALKKRASLEKLRKGPKVFGGIPFIPSAATTKSMKMNFKLKSAPSQQAKALTEKKLSKKAVAGIIKSNKSVSRENTPLRQRHKFDLRASLAKKLPYKPHTGPLKPLNDINVNMVAKPPALKIEAKNQVVTKARAQAREVLHNVRKNKRFMLQMNNRNLSMSIQ